MCEEVFTDAWIFLSIGDAADGWAPLERVIIAADMNNHDVPSRAEVEGAVRRLAVDGLVEVKLDRVRLTEAGRVAYRDAHRPGVGHIRRMFDLGEQWRRSGRPTGAPTPYTFSPTAFEDALKRWREA
ncbi:MAG TPA: hypothetical protein VMU20_11505 [Candidatus Dormibacteraeota bacterium]|nr:hypothetical protein [Candidatus Dormibacteraeota bacterium]